MTVKELIKQLQELPDQDREIMIWGTKYSEYVEPATGLSDYLCSGDGNLLDESDVDGYEEEYGCTPEEDGYYPAYLLS